MVELLAVGLALGTLVVLLTFCSDLTFSDLSATGPLVVLTPILLTLLLLLSLLRLLLLVRGIRRLDRLVRLWRLEL